VPQVSAEIRWFLPAAEAAQVEAFTHWFNGGPFSPNGGMERIDVYAHDTSTDEIGAKERNQKAGGDQKPGIEVKALVHPALGTVSIGTRDAAIQVWTKVGSRAIRLPNDVDARCTTRKVRWLRKFDTSGKTAIELELGGGESREEPKSGARPDVGCNVEWTTVEVDGDPRQWRSFGAEAFAFGVRGGLEATLEAALRSALAALEERLGPPPTLGDDWLELSYPAWIRALGDGPR
jgi:hypothetical protein